MTELPDPGAFGAAFEDFMRAMSFVAEHKESDVSVRLRQHLAADPKEPGDPVHRQRSVPNRSSGIASRVGALARWRPPDGGLVAEAGGVSSTPGLVSELLHELRQAMREHNVFRGPGDGAPGGPGEGPFPAMLHALGAAGLPIPPSSAIGG